MQPPLHRRTVLRKVLMPVFARVNPGDITIKHAHTREPFRLHSFRHRGFWFRASHREAETMALLRRLITPGQTIVEAGGHIGFMTLFFSELVGPGGRVVVFEPGENNLPYLQTNTAGHPNICLVEQAVGDFDGTTTFFIEGLSGQNNSMFSDYEVFQKNQSAANIDTPYRPTQVSVTRLDTYLAARGLVPDLLKIDIEGAEYEALRGAEQTLRDSRPAIMIEVTRNEPAIVDFLVDAGYALLTDTGQAATRPLRFNVFALHRTKHATHLRGLQGR